MSKLLKSKILLGVMIVAVLVVGAGLFVKVASADTCTLTTLLKQTSKGAEVTCLQTKLGVTPATGYFGPITKAKVVAYQTDHGLTADGIVGAMTRAALNATVAVVPPTDLCPNGMTLASNCTMLPNGTVTETLCPNGMTLVSNCMTAPGTTPVVTGQAGDITVSNTSVDVETDVTEGATNVKVLGFKVEATGSNVTLNNVKVAMKNVTPGASSTRLERYVSDVSVWMGSTKVGTAVPSDFTKDGTTYTYNIPLTGATVMKGTANKQTFYVALSALPNIDSTDLGADDWTVGIGDIIGNGGIRFTDGTGVVMTDGTSINPSTAINFMNLATSGDVKLKVSKDSSSPVAGNVEASTTSSTSDVIMLVFKVKSEGTSTTFDSVDFTVTGTGATPAQVASELALYDGTARLGDNTSLGTNGTKTITLDEDYTIPAGETRTFTVKAKINKIDANSFDQGDSLLVSYNGFSGTLEDKNGDTITSLSGSAVGETQTFYSEGITASNFTSSFTTTTDSGAVTKQTYLVSFKLTAFGNTYYIPKIVERGSLSDNDTSGMSYLVETSAGATAAAADVTSSQSALTSTDASTVSSYFEIPDGETRTFKATIELTPTAGGVPGYYHVQLNQVLYDLDQTAAGTNEAIYTLSPAQNYETSDSKID